MILLGRAPLARAYRPFDGTDADVSAQGELELELGLVELRQEAGTTFLTAPATVVNLGVAPRLELIADFSNVITLRPPPPPGQRRLALRDTDLLLKGILRRGTLQGESGPSVAVEAGVLLPETGASPAVGAQANTIISFAGAMGAAHFNERVADNREHRLELFSGVIAEGPGAWTVRPVTELFVDHVRRGSSEYSALAGAIWRHGGGLDFDVAARAARLDGAAVWELRVGFTWVARVWQPSAR